MRHYGQIPLDGHGPNQTGPDQTRPDPRTKSVHVEIEQTTQGLRQSLVGPV